MIYIIHDGNQYKIGKSKHPTKRLKQLQTGHPRKLKLVRIYDKPDYLEKRIHYILRNFKARINSEWFSCNVDLVRVVDKIIGVD